MNKAKLEWQALHESTVFSSRNILICVSGLGMGGTERAAVNLATWLQQAGHNVGILTLQSADSDFYPCPSGVRRFGLGLNGESGNFLLAVQANVQRAWVMRRVMRQFGGDVVVSFGDRTNVLALLASWGMSCKKVISERSDPSKVSNGRSWDVLRRWLYRGADIHVAQSQFAARWLSEQVSKLEQVVIGNAVRLPHGGATNKNHAVTWQPARSVRLLCVGRLVAVKGHELLLRALALVSRECVVPFELVLAGDGPLRQHLEAQARQLMLMDKVTFLGAVQNIHDVYQNSDVFVLSSRHEGFPNTLVEAMAHGLPVVATRCQGGVEDVLMATDAEVGLLVPLDDTRALADAIKCLISDPILRARLANAARARSLEYAEEVIRSAWLRVIAVKTVDREL